MKASSDNTGVNLFQSENLGKCMNIGIEYKNNSMNWTKTITYV